MSKHEWAAGQVRRKKPPMTWLSDWAVDHGLEPCWEGNNHYDGEFSAEAYAQALQAWKDRQAICEDAT